MTTVSKTPTAKTIRTWIKLTLIPIVLFTILFFGLFLLALAALKFHHSYFTIYPPLFVILFLLYPFFVFTIAHFVYYKIGVRIMQKANLPNPMKGLLVLLILSTLFSIGIFLKIGLSLSFLNIYFFSNLAINYYFYIQTTKKLRKEEKSE